MKLLLIMPQFFDYPKLIVNELHNLGYEVDFFDDRPSANAWTKAAIRINRNIVANSIKKYFKKIMETVKNKKYDIVFLISGQSLSFDKNMMLQIKNCQLQARFLLYQWDSQANFPYIKQMHNIFDKCYSFDRKDVIENPKLKFLPLFYNEEYENIGKENNQNIEYDCCFIGTAHPKKYRLISLMSKQLLSVYPNQFIYFFFPSPLVYFYRKVMNKELRGSHYNEFHYVPLKGKEIYNVYTKSRCILDSPQAGQTGLTIRVVEALGAKKKLVTTNKDVINYDFYKPENIYVYDNTFDLNDVFFTKKYVSVESDIYKKYSLRSWLEEILSL